MILILPSMDYLATLSGLRRWISLTLMVIAWVAHSFSLAVSAPVCMTVTLRRAYSAQAQPALQKVGA